MPHPVRSSDLVGYGRSGRGRAPPLPTGAPWSRFPAMIADPPRLYFDYVDPLSLLVEQDLAALEADGAPPVARHPFELRPPPTEFVDTDDPLWLRRWEQAAAVAHARGAVLRAPAFVPWTRKAHELALHAREKGAFSQLHAALYRAFFEEGRDIGRVDVLVTLAAEAGLDRSEAKAVLDVDRHAEVLDDLRGEAERLGIRGVPTLLIAGERIEGLLPIEALRGLIERV